MKLNPSHSICKNQLKMDKDLNVRPETVRLLKENMAEKLHDIGLPKKQK